MPYDPSIRRNSGANTNYLSSYPKYDDVDQPYVSSPEVPVDEQIPVKRKRGRPRKVQPIPEPVIPPPKPVYTAYAPKPTYNHYSSQPTFNRPITGKRAYSTRDIHFVAALMAVGVVYDSISGPGTNMTFVYSDMPRETEDAFYSGRMIGSFRAMADALRRIRNTSKSMGV